MFRYPLPTLIICSLIVASFTSGTPAQVTHPKMPGAAVNVKANSITFAVIGDYGRDSKQEDSVAKMVKSWNPDFIITVGDNNYLTGSAATIKNNIGKYYGDYIYNPDAKPEWQCHGKAEQQKQNMFFPSPGNHDNYSIPPLKPYLDYFTLPGDETNYEFTWGPVHFYSLNTGKSAKGSSDSKQALWLKDALQKETKKFKVVYFHHPPYSAGEHGSSVDMRWPFKEWGVDAVLTGHEHFYARATVKGEKKGPLYLICGNSGSNEHYDCNKHPLDKDKYDWFCDNEHFGAIRVTVTEYQAIFEYFAVEQPYAPLEVNVVRKD